MSRDPSTSSFYVTQELYRRLVEDFAGWQDDAREVQDLAQRDACRRLLEKEARALDERRYDAWLALYAPECLYWVPATLGGGDPRREVAIAFDDRRRLEDRIFRLNSDYAWSQQPASRTARLVSGVAAFATREPGVLMVRSSFLTSELQAGERRTYAGWCAHRLRRQGEGWAIVVKQVNLIDCDRNLRNPSIIL